MSSPPLSPSSSAPVAKRPKTSSGPSAQGPRDYFAELPQEIFERIYSFIPFAEGGWQRDVNLMQLSSRWFWLIKRPRWRTVRPEFDDILPLVDTIEKLPALGDFVKTLEVYFFSAATDIFSDWLWRIDRIEKPLPRPIPPVHDRVFIDRRRIYKNIYPNFTCCGKISEQDEPCPQEEDCTLCKARGRPNWPWQNEHYDEDAFVATGTWITDWETEVTPSDGPTGNGPIKGISGWEDWFAAFAKLATLCRPRVLVWGTSLAEMPPHVVEHLASLGCIRELILDATFIEPHYQQLAAEAEVLQLCLYEESGEDPHRPLTEETVFPPSPWTSMGELDSLPEEVIDDAPPGTEAHALYNLFRCTDARRLRSLKLEPSVPIATTYQSPGLLPILLAVPHLEEDKPYKHWVAQIELVGAVRALRDALSEAATPLTPSTLCQLVESLPQCKLIVKPVLKAAEEICQRFNCRPT